MKRKSKKANKVNILSLFIAVVFTLCVTYFYEDIDLFLRKSFGYNYSVSYSLSEIPEYSGNNYVYIDNNVPNFNDSEKKNYSYEEYSELDYLGRCGKAVASIGIDLMPTKERESIGSVKPSGWHTVKYDFIDGKYLYNRCHLIGYQLTGENANSKNLITCTRQMNTKGMLEFENRVTNYIKKTKNHVLYRVTPIFYDDNLVASGVQMEALSIEDDGKGISFNVFVYNVQDNVEIDYKTGESKLKD